MSQLDYEVLTGQFEAYLSAHQPYGSPDSLYEPFRYINELGGKRIRPVLLLMAYNLWHDDITPALPAALAIEYFHNFSLMHDDIMDEAPIRRGKKTVHTLYSTNRAILSGDAMLIRCFDLLLEAGKPNDVGAELCSLMAKTAMEICEGQQLDMDFEQMESPTETAYLEMIRKKTAVLLGTSLKLGAILAEASRTEQESLSDFGEMMGLGFQIQDDYLDLFGHAGLTGKIQGGDILRGKKNFPYVHTYNTLNPTDRKIFIDAYNQVALSRDVSAVMEYYQRLGTEAHVRAVMSQYVQRSNLCLEALTDRDINAVKNLINILAARSG